MLETQIPDYQNEVQSFCGRVIAEFNPDCIILYGSTARGTRTETSDIDILVIGNNLPSRFFDRTYALSRLRDGHTPIEVVGYTLKEWENMMSNQHLTILEALEWGIPLHGEKLFAKWRSLFREWKDAGLRLDARSWVIPPKLTVTN